MITRSTSLGLLATRRLVRPAIATAITAVVLSACAPRKPAQTATETTRRSSPSSNAAPAAASDASSRNTVGPNRAIEPEQHPAQPEAAAVATASPTATNESLVVRARAQLLEVASSDFTNVRKRTSEMLYIIADLSAGIGAGVEKMRHLQEIRFQAKRLERGDSAVFVESLWVQKALLAALAVLEASPYGERAPDVADRIRVARDATNAIPGHTSVGFERTPIQDALRATVSAFAAAELAHSRGGERAPEPDETAAGS